MPFERYKFTNRSFKPKVTIRKGGTIAFNAGAVTRFGLNKSPFVVLLFDKGKKRIGIQPVKEEEEGAHKLNRGGKGAWISARGFLDFYEIQFEKQSRRFDPSWSEEKDMIIVQV